jgi:hypothetical protein
MMYLRTAQLVIALTFPTAGFAQSKDCEPPAWVKLVELKKKPDELVGAAAGNDPASAWIAAKRNMAAGYADQYADDILKLPQLRGRINTKAYAPKEIARALRLAVAYQIKDPKRIEYEVRCNRIYIALSTSRRGLTAHLRSLGSFSDDIDAALTARIDQLEATTFEKEHQASAADTGDAEEAMKSLSTVAKGLNQADFIEKEMIHLMRARMTELKKATESVQALVFKEDRAKESAALSTIILEAGKTGTAVQDWKDANYVSAGQIFLKCAQKDEPVCQFLTGIMYLQALGVRKDPAEAMKWLRKAAGAGHTVSKLFVGIYTFAGIGTKSDPELAGKWVNEAFQQGWTCDLEIRSCGKGK